MSAADEDERDSIPMNVEDEKSNDDEEEDEEAGGVEARGGRIRRRPEYEKDAGAAGGHALPASAASQWLRGARGAAQVTGPQRQPAACGIEHR